MNTVLLKKKPKISKFSELQHLPSSITHIAKINCSQMKMYFRFSFYRGSERDTNLCNLKHWTLEH